jgi:hypothetical protein
MEGAEPYRGGSNKGASVREPHTSCHSACESEPDISTDAHALRSLVVCMTSWFGGNADHGSTTCPADGTVEVTEIRIGSNRACVTYVGEYFAKQAVTTIDAEIAMAYPSQDCTAILNANEIPGKIAVIEAASCRENVTRLLLGIANARAVIIIIPKTSDGSSESAGFPSNDELGSGTNVPVLTAITAPDAVTLRAGIGAQASLAIGRPRTALWSLSSKSSHFAVCVLD